MKKVRCSPCIGREIKEAILHEITAPNIQELLEHIPDCADSQDIRVCGIGKKGRSPYQQFISQCMKAKNIKGFGAAAPAMRECAKEWRERK